jgi:hypothetical protein
MFECRQFILGGEDWLKFETFQEAHAMEVMDDLAEVGVHYVAQQVNGPLVRMSILDLLDTHWNLHQMIEASALRITSLDDGQHFRLAFVNDGTNLWAEFDATEDNKEEGAKLMQALADHGTKYEVL